MEEANQAAEAKRKLAEAKENEAKAVAEAKRLQEVEAKRQAALNNVRTKTLKGKPELFRRKLQ